jgi:hypothetical protein
MTQSSLFLKHFKLKKTELPTTQAGFAYAPSHFLFFLNLILFYVVSKLTDFFFLKLCIRIILPLVLGPFPIFVLVCILEALEETCGVLYVEENAQFVSFGLLCVCPIYIINK